MIFGSLGVAWCTSTNLQSGQSASLSWKHWFTKQAFTLAGNISRKWSKLWPVWIFVNISFVAFVRCCPLTAAILVPWRSLDRLSVWEYNRSPRCKAKNKSNRSIWASHLIILAPTSGCNCSDKQVNWSARKQESTENKSGRAMALPAQPNPPLRSLTIDWEKNI